MGHNPSHRPGGPGRRQGNVLRGAHGVWKSEVSVPSSGKGQVLALTGRNGPFPGLVDSGKSEVSNFMCMDSDPHTPSFRPHSSRSSLAGWRSQSSQVLWDFSSSSAPGWRTCECPCVTRGALWLGLQLEIGCDATFSRISPHHIPDPYFLLAAQSPANSPTLETWRPLVHFLPLCASQFTIRESQCSLHHQDGLPSPLLAADPAPSSHLRVHFLGLLTLSDLRRSPWRRP